MTLEFDTDLYLSSSGYFEDKVRSYYIVTCVKCKVEAGGSERILTPAAVPKLQIPVP